MQDRILMLKLYLCNINTVMRKILTLICAVSATLALLASPMKDDEKSIPVPITKEGTKKGGVLRAPEVVPIKVFLMKDLHLLSCQFNRNLGDVNIELMNTMTGEYVSDIIDSCTGMSIFPFSCNEGFYTLTFTLQDGTMYIGEFEI